MMRKTDSPGIIRVLVDTNIWLDYFLSRMDGHRATDRFIAAAGASERIALYVASLTLKDLAFLLAAEMKRGARADGRQVTPDVAASAREVAWGCVRHVLDLALVVPIGHDEILHAFTYKRIHNDLEDDIILAAAARSGAGYILTNDTQLAARSPIPCIGIDNALQLLGEPDNEDAH